MHASNNIHLSIYSDLSPMSSDQATLSATSQSLLDNIRIVLVNTTHPGNIGGVARAIKNMGLTQLYLVDPKDYPSERAEWRASNAADVLATETRLSPSCPLGLMLH